MVPKNMLDKLVSPHSSVDKVVSANSSILSGHEFESPKVQQGRRKEEQGKESEEPTINRRNKAKRPEKN